MNVVKRFVCVRIKRHLVAITAVLLLCACFETDRPLLKQSDIVTPLPSHFSVYALDENGKIDPGASGTPSVTNNVTLYSSKYIKDNTSDKQSFTIATLSDAFQKQGIYILEYRVDNQFFYGLIRLKDDELTLFFPPTGDKDEGKLTLLASLKSADVKFTDTGSFFRFDDGDQLLAAARVYAQTIKFEQLRPMYRVVDKGKPEDVARLARDLAQSQVAAQTHPKPTPESLPNTDLQVEFQAYSHPNFFERIYRGDADPRRLSDLDIIFLQEFLKNFAESSDCNHLVPKSTYALMTAKATPAALRNQMKDYNEASRQRRARPPSTGPIDFGKIFMEGANEALGPLLSAAKEIDNARNDAILFAKHYGCRTPAAKRFFENIEILVTQL
jgi:hypothetical protein